MQRLGKITAEQWEKVNPENSKLLYDFLENSVELSPQSRKTYESNLKIWFVWVAENLNNKFETEIKSLDFKKYQNWLVNRGCSYADVCNKRAAISSLNQYVEIYYGDDYPTFRNFINKSIKRPPKVAVREKAPLTKEEFTHLIEVLKEQGRTQIVAYLMFTFETGCRRAESRQLLKNTVDIQPTVHPHPQPDGSVKETRVYYTAPIRCKGAGEAGKVRKLTFGDEAMDALKAWVAERGEDDCPYMFVSKYGGEVKQVSEATFNSWFTRYINPIVGRDLHPHSIRASRASQAVVEEGKDIHAVQKLLGHESAETTEIYVVRPDDDSTDELF